MIAHRRSDQHRQSDSTHAAAVESEQAVEGSERPVAIILGIELSAVSALCHDVCLIPATNADDLFRHVAECHTATLLLGPQLATSVVTHILRRCSAEYRDGRINSIIIGNSVEPTVLQDFIDEDSVFYVSRAPLPHEELSILLRSATLRRHVPSASQSLLNNTPDPLLQVCGQLLTQTDLSSAAGLVAEAMGHLIEGSQCDCLLLDSETHTIRLANRSEDIRIGESAAVGIAGYVARTGTPVLLERVGLDPRYEIGIDNPLGDPDAHFLAQPILDSSGLTIAIMRVLRESTAPAFLPTHLNHLARFSQLVSPVFTSLVFAAQVEEESRQRVASTVFCAGIYRKEALEAGLESKRTYGDVLTAQPRWLGAMPWVLLVAFLAVVAWMITVRVDDCGAGPAIIRASTRVDILAPSSGVVRSINVMPGDPTQKDTLIARYQTGPLDTVDVHAPGAGVIAQLWIRPGQQLTKDDRIATLADDSGDHEVIAFLPGVYAPHIYPGASAKVTPRWYPTAHQFVTLESVGEALISANVATEYLGIGAVSKGEGVLIRAHLGSRGFGTADGFVRYRDGLPADTEVCVSSTALITKVLPRLKAIWPY